MSEERNEEPAEQHPAPAEAPSTEPAGRWSSSETRAPPADARRRGSRVVLSLGAMLVLLIAIVLAAPFWAMAVMPLLPWARQSETHRYDALAARVAALEQRQVAPAINVDAVKSAQAAVTQHLAALEDNVAAIRREAGMAASKTDLDQQAQRLDALEKAVAAIQQDSDTASIKADLIKQSQRLDAISAQRDASETAAIQKIRQDMAERGIAESEWAKRLDVLEHQVHSQNGADRAGSALLLALLQMREAVEVARPFPAEYAAFENLAAHDPELTAAGAPLAEPARNGVASRAVLRQRLADLADQITTIRPPAAKPAKPKWWAQALTQLEGLVTIRHIEPSTKTGPQATIDAAHTDLAQGDLGAAVAAVGTLTGANAEAAQPWLRMARQRLAAETALGKLQALLTSRVGAPPAVSPASTSPAPGPAPAMPKTPS